MHLVGEILDEERPRGPVLDPFCGTATTALVCAERGIACDTTDINSFLLWLAVAKTRRYTPDDLRQLDEGAARTRSAIAGRAHKGSDWTPALHRIERWWDAPALADLARAWAAIRLEAERCSTAAVDLLRVAFCRTLIETANVSFGHQSMSFRKASDLPNTARVAGVLADSIARLRRSAASPIAMIPRAILCDARSLRTELAAATYACVITSPPYPNRMSYVRAAPSSSCRRSSGV